MNCPYRDDYDAMKMIRHDLCRAELDLWISHRQGIPNNPDNLACVTSLHLSLFDFPEQTLPSVRDDRNEVRARLGIIVVWQANRLPVLSSVEGTMVFLRVVFHSAFALVICRACT